MALTDRLRALSEHSEWTLDQLRRQFAYDRLLVRLYMSDSGWIVKGAVALLARDIGVRKSLDIDLYRATESASAEAELREAASRDIGDWFRFEVGPRNVISGESSAVRLPVAAYIGQQMWERFSVDLVGADLRMTGEPDDVPPIAQVDMPELQQSRYRAYPLVDHVADKVVATFELHGSSQRPSTRFRDLVDLVAIVRGASVAAPQQLCSLRSEAERRGVPLPQAFQIPDRALWERGYAREARDSLLTDAQTLDDALAVVRPFVNPLLQGIAGGHWDHDRFVWTQKDNSGRHP